ncbi:MAG: hsp70 family protein [Deltaproteobacteria bacterium]|nr:hsp70 family protein [Deltaproteobacteria bacterium]
MIARYIVGIDLGTTHTVVAYADTEQDTPQLTSFDIAQWVGPLEQAKRPLLPSARYHPQKGELPGRHGAEPVIGEWALALGARTPSRLVTSAKSWLSHAGVDRRAPILPWGAPDEVPKISPVEASSSYIALVRARWDASFPSYPLATQEVVLTVPASFDEAARALTLTSAREAGLPKVRLVEEPQAAFYHFLDAHRDDLEEKLAGLKLALVVDVGGGTTDLTLIQIELREHGPRLTRIAVGDHLMLGGDNMDLTLARRAEARISPSRPLGTARFTQLVQQCRAVKEQLLSELDGPARKVTVLGSGSKLIGGSVSTEIDSDEVLEQVVDGFFPVVDSAARPSARRAGIVEFGLPYVSDAAITRHIAAFLAREDELCRVALGESAPAQGELAVPDAVLLNGGVFAGRALRERLVSTLTSWRGSEPRTLDNRRPDRAVALGAVAYGLARRGLGLRIGGGSARSYFLMVDGGKGANDAICLLPRGADEGEEIELVDRSFSLRLGQPVRFHLMSTPADVRHVRAGQLIEIERPEEYEDLPPIAAVLADDATSESKQELPVRLVVALTEVGTLEMSCVSTEDASRRFKLEFQLRGASSQEVAAQRVTSLHPRFQQATELVRRVYGKRADDASPREVKRLRVELERILGKREQWDTPLLRELFGALLAGKKRRRRSADHERVWLGLAGYTLRPGFGYPLDGWRVGELADLLGKGVQFPAEAQNWAELWTLWRRIAGGLDAEAQQKLLEELAFYLEPPSRRPRKRPPGPKKLGYDAMVRLVGSLERLPKERKAQLGGWLVQRLASGDENEQTFWAVGRLGARVPFYGSAHQVVPAHVATEWLELALSRALTKGSAAAFAVTLLARRSGDRGRDLSDGLRAEVASKLESAGASRSWVAMVREVTHLEEADQRRVFGESLPPGLRLMD